MQRFFFALLVFTALFSASWAFATDRNYTITDAVLRVSVLTDVHGKECITRYEAVKGNRKFKIHFRRKGLGHLKTGLKVQLKGKRWRGAFLVVGSSSSDLQVLNLQPLAEPAIIGSRSLLVLRIQSSTSVTAASETQLASVMNQINTRYQEYTFSQLSFTNDRQADGKADVYTTNITRSTAALTESYAFTVCSEAAAAARTQFGIEPGLWTHLVCILPPDMSYSWFGQAYVGGQESVINGNYTNLIDGYTHELGHNLGMHHGNSGAVFPGTEYGDSSCIMGGNANTAPRHFNGPHNVQMGWIPSTTVSKTNYTLDALEVAPANRSGDAVVLKIRDTVANQDLFISYRANIGSYSNGPINPLKTAVHYHAGGGTQTLLLKALADGESFVQNGISVKQISHTSTTAAVEVLMPCAASSPSITITPATQSAKRGVTLTYTVTVTNRDQGNCTSATSFSLAAVVANGAGIGATLEPASLSLNGGVSGTSTLTILGADTAVLGKHAITISSSATGHSAASGLSEVTLVADSPPLAPKNLRIGP